MPVREEVVNHPKETNKPTILEMGEFVINYVENNNLETEIVFDMLAKDNLENVYNIIKKNPKIKERQLIKELKKIGIPKEEDK